MESPGFTPPADVADRPGRRRCLFRDMASYRARSRGTTPRTYARVTTNSPAITPRAIIWDGTSSGWAGSGRKMRTKSTE